MANAMTKRFDTGWFSSRLNEEVLSIEWSDVSALGFVSGVKKVKVTLKSGRVIKLVLKVFLPDMIVGRAAQSDEDSKGDAAPNDAPAGDPASSENEASTKAAEAVVDLQTVISMGCAREADFYNAIDKQLSEEKRRIVKRFMPRGHS